jgi:DNA-binding NtrC family response regulator
MSFRGGWEMEKTEQKTILIIEAHKALQMLYEAELQEQGFNTLCASSSTEAQQLLEDHAIDLLMSDLLERRASGMSQLIALARERDIPLVINTGYPLNMIDQSAISGATWIQEKSSDIDKLKDKISELLGKVRPTFQPYPRNKGQSAREGTVEQCI